MPHQFEVKDPAKILCFIPSGHRVGDEFVDLPTQEGYTCWYHTTYQLISMCYTQRGFDPEAQPPLVKRIIELKDMLLLRFYIEFFCNYLVQVLFKKYPVDTTNIFKFLRDDLTPSRLEGTLLNIVQSLKESEVKKQLKSNARHIANEHYETFKQSCLEIAKLVVDSGIKPLDQTAEEAITNCSKDYFIIQNNNSYEAFFATAVAHDKFSEEELSALANAKTQAIHLKNTVYFNSMWQLYMRANDIETSTLPAYINWKATFRELLERKGPIIISGYVGCDYYEGAPKAVGKLGSVSLFGFSKDTYKPNEIAHTVLIIGIVNDKVIFLDPKTPVTAAGPRRAYVMGVDTFMSRVIQFQQKVYGPDIIPYSQVDPKKIDTTLELMHKQTILDNADDIVAGMQRASLSPRN